jgi:hypothetical protein
MGLCESLQITGPSAVVGFVHFVHELTACWLFGFGSFEREVTVKKQH